MRLRTTLILVPLTALAVLVSASVDPGEASAKHPRVYKKGSKGPTVKRIQRRLGVRPVTGRFGRRTKIKVKRFQKRHGLVVDGVVGPATLRAMGISRLSRRERRIRRILRKIALCESGGNPRAVS